MKAHSSKCLQMVIIDISFRLVLTKIIKDIWKCFATIEYWTNLGFLSNYWRSDKKQDHSPSDDVVSMYYLGAIQRLIYNLTISFEVFVFHVAWVCAQICLCNLNLGRHGRSKAISNTKTYWSWKMSAVFPSTFSLQYIKREIYLPRWHVFKCNSIS